MSVSTLFQVVTLTLLARPDQVYPLIFTHNCIVFKQTAINILVQADTVPSGMLQQYVAGSYSFIISLLFWSNTCPLYSSRLIYVACPLKSTLTPGRVNVPVDWCLMLFFPLTPSDTNPPPHPPARQRAGLFCTKLDHVLLAGERLLPCCVMCYSRAYVAWAEGWRRGREQRVTRHWFWQNKPYKDLTRISLINNGSLLANSRSNVAWCPEV